MHATSLYLLFPLIVAVAGVYTPDGAKGGASSSKSSLNKTPLTQAALEKHQKETSGSFNSSHSSSEGGHQVKSKRRSRTPSLASSTDSTPSSTDGRNTNPSMTREEKPNYFLSLRGSPIHMSLKDQIDDPRPDPYVPVVNNDDETWDGPYHIIKEGITTSHTILKKLSNAIFPQSRLDTHAKTQTIKDGVSLIDRLIPTLTSQSNGLENLCRFLKSKPHSRHMHLVDDLFRIDVSELVSATIQHLSYIPSEHKDEDGLKTRMNANGALDYEKLTLLLRSLRSEISQTVNPSEVEVPHQLLQTNVLASLTLVTRATLRLLVIQQVLTVITAVEKLVDLQADGAKWLGD